MPQDMRIGCVLAVPWLAIAWLRAGDAAADPELIAERAVVVGRVDDGPWTDAPTEARADQKAELAAVVVGHRGKRRVVLAPAGVARVSLGGRTTATDDLGDARVQWSTVEPHGFRSRPAGNGATSDFYINVSTEPATFGRWLGFDHIECFERIVAPWGGPARVPAAVTSGEDKAQQLPGLGTVRFKVEVELAGRTLARIVVGPAELDDHGMPPRPISGVREGDLIRIDQAARCATTRRAAGTTWPRCGRTGAIPTDRSTTGRTASSTASTWSSAWATRA